MSVLPLRLHCRLYLYVHRTISICEVLCTGMSILRQFNGSDFVVTSWLYVFYIGISIPLHLLLKASISLLVSLEDLDNYPGSHTAAACLGCWTGHETAVTIVKGTLSWTLYLTTYESGLALLIQNCKVHISVRLPSEVATKRVRPTFKMVSFLIIGLVVK